METNYVRDTQIYMWLGKYYISTKLHINIWSNAITDWSVNIQATYSTHEMLYFWYKNLAKTLMHFIDVSKGKSIQFGTEDNPYKHIFMVPQGDI